MLGEFLRAKRKAKGLSISALARAAKLSHTYVSDVERGEIKLPSLPVLQALARALEIDFGELLQAAGIAAPPDLAVPPDPRVVELAARLGADPSLETIVGLWPQLGEKDRAALIQAATDLARLRQLIQEARQQLEAGEPAGES